MPESPLIDAVKAEDADAVASHASPDSVDAVDEHGWTALCWAAGMGQATIARLLLDKGADADARTPDGRNPYEIALAAGHTETARLLAADAGPTPMHPYCRAYMLSALRQYPGWREAAATATTGARSDDDIVFVHDDLTVTASVWPDEDVVFAEVTDEWRRFLEEELDFRVPDDFDVTT